MLSWFQKSKKKIPEPEGSDNDQIQGSYTGFQQSPWQIRKQLSPMHGDELEAFNWVLDHLGRELPDYSLNDLVQTGLDRGWFYLGENGELRVSEEAPE